MSGRAARYRHRRLHVGVMKRWPKTIALAAALALMPMPADARGVAGGIDCDQRAHLTGGCGWVAPAGQFAYCRVGMGTARYGYLAPLRCFSTVSGFRVDLRTRGLDYAGVTVAQDIRRYVGYRHPARVVRREWRSDSRHDSAHIVCRSNATFFVCDADSRPERDAKPVRWRMWFKPNGSFGVLSYTGNLWVFQYGRIL